MPEDDVVVADIEIDGVPQVDPSSLLIAIAQITGVEPISRERFFLELPWKVRAFQGGCVASGC